MYLLQEPRLTGFIKPEYFGFDPVVIESSPKYYELIKPEYFGFDEPTPQCIGFTASHRCNYRPFTNRVRSSARVRPRAPTRLPLPLVHLPPDHSKPLSLAGQWREIPARMTLKTALCHPFQDVITVVEHHPKKGGKFLEGKSLIEKIIYVTSFALLIVATTAGCICAADILGIPLPKLHIRQSEDDPYKNLPMHEDQLRLPAVPTQPLFPQGFPSLPKAHNS
jgi:hypothetical protein